MLSKCSPLTCHDRIGNADRMENVESKKWECEVLRLPTRSKTGRIGACAQALCLPTAVQHRPLARPAAARVHCSTVEGSDGCIDSKTFLKPNECCLLPIS